MKFFYSLECELQRAWNFVSFVYCCLSNALNIRNTQQILWINGRNLFESIVPAYEPSHTPFSVSTRAQLSLDISFASSSFHSTIREGLGLLTTTRGWAPLHPEHPFWPALIPQESNEGNQRTEMWRPPNSWKYFRTQKVLGTVMERQFPFQPLHLITKSGMEGCIGLHWGLQFWYFSRFSLFLKNPIITMFLVNPQWNFHWWKVSLCHLSLKGWSCRGFCWTWIIAKCSVTLSKKKEVKVLILLWAQSNILKYFPTLGISKIPSMFGLGPYFFLIAEPKGNLNPSTPKSFSQY